MPKVSKELKRSLMLHIRVSPSEKKLIQKKAKGYRTLTDYAREKMLNCENTQVSQG